MSAKRFVPPNSELTLDRRKFLATSGTGLLAAAALPMTTPLAAAASSVSAESPRVPQGSSTNKRKIPIGVFDPVYPDLSLDAMLEKVSALGLEAMEIGTGGYPGSVHCPVDELLADPAKARAWLKKFEDHGLRVATLSCHGNPLHHDTKHAATDRETFKKTVLLAERIGVKVI